MIICCKCKQEKILQHSKRLIFRTYKYLPKINDFIEKGERIRKGNSKGEEIKIANKYEMIHNLSIN